MSDKDQEAAVDRPEAEEPAADTAPPPTAEAEAVPAPLPDPAPETKDVADLAEQTSPPPAPARGGGGAMVLVVLLLGAGATALAWFDPLGWRGDGPSQAAITALTERLDATEKAGQALQDRLAKLEAAPTVSAETVEMLEKTVQENQATLGAIRANPSSGGEVSADEVSSLAESVARLERQVASLDGQGQSASPGDVKAAVDAALAEREAEANATVEAARQQAARIEAVQRLRDAARSGAPYADLLPALDGLPVDPVLVDAAGTGLVTQSVLADTFPEAARKALDASLRASDGGDGLGDRFLSFLRIQTGARSLEPQEGDDPDAVLSRAEAAVKAGDVATALTELAALPPEGQAEMAGWIATAQAWQAAHKALNDLAAAAGVEGG